MDIAIYGGSFDPPHIGHEKIVNLVLKNLSIDKLFIVPAFLNPFKSKYHLEPTVRLELIKELFSDLLKVQVCDFEIKSNKPITTYETIKYIKDLYKIDKIYLIIGSDNLKTIHLWYNFTILKDLVEFIVINRPNFPLTNKHIKFKSLLLNEDISSSQLRDKMELDYIPQKIKQKVKKLWKIE